MNKSTFLTSSMLAAGLVLLTASSAFATASVSTLASAGISADTAGTGGSGAYTTLTGPVLTEGANRDINTGTIVLSAPTGFQFNAAATVTATVTQVAGSGTAVALSSGTATVTASTITITVSGRDTSDGSTRSSITWSGIQVRPTAGSPLASGNITDSGTATISGISGSTSFGTLTEVAGTTALVRVETAANGSGTVVGTQNITAGNAITVYAITRDANSNFVANVAADSWSLTGIAGGVVSGDLVPAGDSKSAVFTAHLAGSAVIHAPSGSLTTTDSGTLTVVGGPASKLVFITAPQSLTAGVSSSVITVQIQDAGGNPTNATAARKITLSSTSGGGIFRNLADTLTITSITNAIGQNATNFLYKDTVTGTPTITAATTSPTTLTSATQVETVGAANAAMVRVETAANGTGTIVPAQNVIAGNAITLYAITRDAFSNFVANVAADSWSLTGVTGGVLSGDLIPAGDNKSAAFTGHVIGTAKVHAPSGALTATDSGILTVLPGPVTQLTFTTQPANATAGAVFGTQPVVNSQDQFGNNSTNGLPATASITVSLTAGTGPLQGITITNIGLAGGKGIGAFTNLRLDVAGTDKQLTASSTNGLAGEASSIFTVSPAVASKLVIATQPSASATAGVIFTQQPVIQIQDAFNNLRNADTLTVTAARSAGSGTLQGTTAIAAVAGVATYTDLSHQVATNITLAFTSGALSSVTSSVVAVSAATPALVRVETAANGSGTVVGTQNITAGNAITNYAITRDAFNNFVANVAADSWSLTGIAGGVVSGDLVPAGDSKSAVFTAHLAGSAVIHAPSGSLTATDSGTLTVVGGPASKLVFITAPQSLTAGVNSSVITVQIQDVGGNPTNATAARPITLSTTSGGGIFRNLADTLTITSITNAIGQNATNFLYKDTVTGTPTITAATTSPTALTSATQAETVNVASAAMVRVETAANGTGTIVPAQNVIAGNAITLYAITRDAFSNFVANVAADSWSLTGVTGGVLSGDLIPAGDNKSAAFTGHVIGTAKVHAPSGALTATDSGILTVLPGPVTQLTFTTQPANATAGAVFGTQPVVNSQDQFGNNSTNGLPATASITVSLTAGTGPLQGTTITNIGLAGGKGIGAFTNLRLDVAGTDKQLTASSTNGLAGEASSIFTVSPAVASKLVIATQPSASATAGVIFTQQPVIQIQDAFNNLRNADTLTVTAARSAGSGTLQGTTAIAAVAGVATYTDLSHQVATNITLAFTSGALSSVTSSVVAVSAATPALVRVETAANGSGTVVGTQNITAGNAITNYAITRDAFNNFVANVAADSWSLTGIAGGVVSGDLVPAGDSKSAVFTAHLAGSAVIHAPSGSLTATDSGTLTVVGGPASKLVFITAPQSLTAGVNSSVITVQIQDVGGNPTNATAARPITLSTTSGGGIFRNLADTLTITSITNAIGQNATNFLYKDTVTGTPTITAATTSPTTLTSATQVETVGAANAAMVRVETAANGTGTIVPAQNVIAGNAITLYAITRDAFSNFVANVAADSWSLTGVTGGVLSGDLIPAGDNKSAAFTGHVIGTAKVHAPSGALTATDSGILTVLPGPVTQLTFTTQPANATAGAVFGTQPVVNSQDQFGNNSTNGLPATASITVSLTAGTGPLQGITITNIGLAGGKGIGAFTNLRLDVAGTDKQLTASSTNGLAGEASSIFTVSPGAINHYAVSASSPQTRGTPFTVTVTAQDIGNNTVPDSSTVVTLTGSTANVQFDANGDSIFGDNTQTLANGVCTISTKDNIGETITVTATDANGNTGTSASIIVNGTAGDYRSTATGNWNSTNTWQIWNGSAWVAATSFPAGGAGTNITILSTNTVTDNVAVTNLGTLVVQGTLSFSGSGAINVNSGGILQNSGTVNSSTATLTFNPGGLYQHNYTTSAGTIPTATWNTGSTCEIVGYTTDTTAPGGLGQSFANFTWNCPNQGANTGSLAAGLTTVGGVFTMANGNLFWLNSGSAGSVTVNLGDDLVVQGGTFTWDNAGSGTFTLNVGGSYNQTGGRFQNLSSSGVVTIHLTGANEAFIQSGGTLNTANMNFAVDATASYALGNNLAVASGQTFTINGALNCGTNIVSGAGTFTLASGGTLNIGDPNGITASGATGNIQTTTRNFNAAANYVYAGSAAQVTGSGLTSANNLTITNTAGVTLSGTATNTGVLTLSAGVLATGGNTMVVATSGSISGANTASYVNGTVRKIFPTGNSQAFAFPVGDASNYTPINLSSLNVTTAGSLTAKTTASEHPQISGSGINSSADVNRYWTLTNSPSGIVVSADTATFNFVPGDVDAGANTANFVVRRYNASWSNTVTGSQGATSTSASSITNFGDFAIGDQSIDHYVVGTTSPQTAGNTFNTTVTAQDKINQTVPDSATVVAMSASSGNVQFDSNGDGTFGDNTKTLSNGAFTISTKDNVAENFTMTATDGNSKSGTSQTITNNAAAANTIVFVQGPPSSVTAATTLSPAVTIKITDQFNNPVNGVSVSMTLNGGGTLGGTTTQTTANGVATFNNLTVNQTGTKTLTASISSPALSVTSSSFTVTPAAATILRVETAADGSGTVVSAQNVTAGNSVTVYAIARDANTNFVANSNATWTLTGTTGGVTGSDLTPSSGTSATFTGHWVGSGTVHAVAGALSGNSGTLTVVPGAALNLFVTLPGQTFTNSVGNGGTVSNQTAGTAFNLKLTAADQFTNIATSYAGAKTISYSGPGGSPTFTTSVTFTNGQSSNTLATILPKAETTTITATDGTLTGIPSSTLTNKPAAYSKLQLLVPGETAAPGTASGKTGSPTPETVAIPFGVAVNAVDANWNLIATNDTIRIFSSDTSATLPAANALVAGTQTFNVTFLTAGSQTLTASNVTHSAITTSTSPAITVNKGSQTITFNPLANHSYGEAPFALNATASSGLAVTYSIVSGPATVSGNTLTITGVGTVTVDASQPGNANWNAATDVQQSFNVVQGNQTITFNALPNHTYGDAPFPLSATASSGLAVSFSIVSGPATLSGNTLTITGTGTVTVDASQPGNANWNPATDVQQSFNVAKANQTITFNPLPSRTYGDVPFALSATASSGLSVTFTVASGPATISGNTLTITGAGTVEVNADQAGDANWNTAVTVQQSFLVNPASLTVSGITASNKVYDGTTTAALNTAGATLIGAVGGDDVELDTNGATGAFSDANVATDKPVNVGGLTLTGTNAGNYTLTQPVTTADITPVQLTVSADNQTRAYGATNPVLTASYSGFVNNETNNVVGGSPDLSTDADTNSPVGSYVITNSIGTLNAVNYTFNLVNGTLTVTQAVLTVSADNQLRPYGQTNPVFTVSYSGFVNGEDTNVLSGNPDLTTDADTNSPVGAYVITNSIGTLSATNYSFVFSNGVLTVGPVVLTPGVTVGDKVYDGTTNATITGYSLGGVIGNDDVNLTNGLASFGDRNIGTNKPVTVTSLGLAGADADKYVLATNTLITAASITPELLTVSAVADSKVYDGTAASTATPAITTGSVQAGDTAAFTQGYDTANAGTGKTLTPAGSINDSNGGNNYLVTFEPNTDGVISPASLSITADNTNKVYGQTITFTGTEFAVSGLINGDSVTGVTLNSDGTTSTASVGSHLITPSAATGSGLGNYNISYNPGTLTVNQASLTITADDTNKVYGQTVVFTGTEFTVSGLVDGDSVDSVTLASDGATNTAGAGSYNIVPGAAAGSNLENYSITYSNGTLTVNPANLTVTADNTNKVYGQTITFAGTEFTVSGLTNGDTVDSVTLTSDGAVNTAGFGSYNIVPDTAAGSGLENYTITYVNGTLTVAKAALTVTADYTVRNVGETNPVFTASYNGFVNSEDSNVLSGEPGLSTLADTNSPAGIYTISISGGNLSATNYSFTLVDGILDVTPPNDLFYDNFLRPTNALNSLSPWILQDGTWAITNNQLQGVGDGLPGYYGHVYIDTNWTDYSVQAQIQFSSTNIWAGGVGGRLDSTTGAHYALWVFPEGSQGADFPPTVGATGTPVLKLMKFQVWQATTDQFTVMAEVNLPPVGTDAHTVTLTFQGTNLSAYFDGVLEVSTNDPDSLASGGITVDAAGYLDTTDTFNVQNVAVAALFPSQTITFGSLPDKTFGDAPFAASATASSGLPVTFSIVSGPATISGSTITLTGAGTVTVRASQTGDINYPAAPDVDQSFTVNPALLTVTASNDTKTYDGAAYSGGNGVSYTGFVNGQDSSVLGGTLTYSGNSQGATNAGAYTITPGGLTSSNYSITFADGSLTIYPATPTLTWGNPANIGYGTALGGGQLNATADVAGTLAYSPASGTVLNAGNGQTLSVTFTPADSLNYNPASTNVLINVNPASLTVTADSFSRAYGATNPLFTAGYNGFVNNDGSGVLTGTLNFSCLDTNSVAVDTNTPVGTYPITVSGQSAANYNLSYVAGTLVVTQAVLTVSADSLNRPYGATNPVPTASYSGFVNGENTNVLSGSPDLTIDADTNSPVGIYPIEISLGTLSTNGNYSFNFTNGTLTVTAYALTLNVDSQTRAYGQTNATLTGSLIGLQNGDAITASYATAADTNSDVGTYPITVTLTDPGNLLPNYTVTTNSGSLTVTQAVLTVTASNDTKTYDGAAYSGGNGVSYTGFVNGQDSSVLGGTLTYSGNSQGATNAGAYTITPGGLTSSNYSITFADGSLTIYPATPTLTWGNPANIGYGTALGGGQLNATADVAGTLAYSPASGTVLNAGNGQTLSVTFTPADSLNYNPASTNVLINVNPASLTVTADSFSRAYGATNPLFTAGYNGFVNNDGSGVLTGTLNFSCLDTNSVAVDTNTPVGTYPITVSGQSAANYNLSYVAGTLVVTQAVLTVSADSLNRPYGATNPVPTASYSGFVNGENTNVLSGSPDLTIDADTNSPVGIYPIEISLGTLSTNGNYSFNFTNGTLTVTAYALTLNVDSQTRAYGQTNATLTGSLIGLQNGDAITASYATAADTNSDVGTYPITVTLTDPGNLLPNYTVTTNSGSLTVTQAVLTVTASNDTKTYDGAAYSGGNGVSYTGFVNGQDSSVLGGTLTYSGNSQGATNAGAYTITPGGLTSSNYSITFADGSLTIYPATPTLTWGNPANIGYGTALGGGQLNATADVAGTLAYSPASGTVLNAGNGQTLSVTFTPADSLNYNPASTNVLINVNPASLTVTADSFSRAYGATNPLFTAGYNGFVNNDGSGVLTGTLNFSCLDTNSVAVDTNTPVGTYPITVSGQSAANYNLSYVAGTLVVTQAVLTVSADSLNRPYGATNPVPTASYSGFVNGENTNVLSGNPSLTIDADTNSPVGIYPIEVSLGTLSTNGNYSFNFTNGTLTVTAYALTVNVDSQTRAYGQTNATLTGSLIGLQNGDAITASYATAADTNSDVGTYPITVTLTDPGNLLPNYTVTTNSGSLTVTQAVLTVTASNDTKTYDGAAYSGGNGVSYTGFVNGQDSSVLGGTLTYSGNSQGATNAGAYTITPGGLTSSNYSITFADGSLTIYPATPTLTWGNPADITYGTALSGTQLNATSGGVAGDFVYTPASGTVLNAGNGQTLSVTFTPTDTANYNTPSAETVTINVSKADQTITFGALSTKTYGDAPFGLTATADSGLTVSYTSSDTTVATVSGGIVTILNAGSTTITASQTGNGNYNAAVSVPQTLTVNQLALTVTADAKSKTYGAIDPAFTYQVTGGALVPGDSFTGNLTRATGENVGTHAILQGTLAAGANYNLTYTGADLTITPADSANALISSANPSSQSSNVTFTATLTPVAPATTTPTGNVQFFTNGIALGGPVTLNGGVATISTAQLPAGTNTVMAAYLGDANFNGSSNSLMQVVTLQLQTPSTTGIKNNGDGTVTITFTGTPAGQYIVQAITSLGQTGWANVSTNTAGADGHWTFTDSTAGQNQRFYRSGKP